MQTHTLQVLMAACAIDTTYTPTRAPFEAIAHLCTPNKTLCKINNLPIRTSIILRYFTNKY